MYGFGVENPALTYHAGCNHNFYVGSNNSNTYGTLAMAVISTGNVNITGVVSAASIGASGGTIGTLYATTITSANAQLSGTISAGTHVGSLMSSASIGAAGATIGTLYRTPQILCMYYAGATSGSIANGSSILIPFDTTVYTTGNTSMGLTYSTSGRTFTNSGSSTLNLMINYSVAFTGSSTGSRQTWISQSNISTVNFGAMEVYASNNGGYTIVSGSCALSLASSAYFAINAYQNSGVSLGFASSYTNITISVL